MSLAFPDVNVWLALASEEHVHRPAALSWWQANKEAVGFCRFTQLGFRRLISTAVVMNQRPLSLRAAWKVYDSFFIDERVQFVPEPAAMEHAFRRFSASPQSSPKLLADAYLLAFASNCGGTLVTFDRALARRGSQCLVIG